MRHRCGSPPDARVIPRHFEGLYRHVGKRINGVRQWGLLYANPLQPEAELDADGKVVASSLFVERPNLTSLMPRDSGA